jgi:flagellar biosynthetic protein FlhB
MSEEEDKKHAPSEKKWREAAEEGQLPKSQDINSVAVLFAGGVALFFATTIIGPSMRVLFRYCFDISHVRNMEVADLSGLAERALSTSAMGILVPLGAVFIAALIAGASQTQLRLATKAIGIKWERIDPIANFKTHYLSATPLVELVKSLLKLGAIGGITLWILYDKVAILPTLTAMSPIQLSDTIRDLAFSMLLAAIPVVILIAALDYSYAYYKTYQQIKRTDEELKRETKDQNGDPHLRGKRRQRAREMANARSLERLPEADVIITNPTHYAIALRYQRGVDQSPIVVAKGVDELALKIRQKAFALNIPRVENRPLARGLFAKAKIGAPIPDEWFGPVAQVLAVVYRRRADRRLRQQA